VIEVLHHCSAGGGDDMAHPHRSLGSCTVAVFRRSNLVPFAPEGVFPKMLTPGLPHQADWPAKGTAALYGDQQR
jgi:hypothetical protein